MPPRKREVFFSLARSKPLLLHLPPPQLCKECFYAALEREVHATIVEHGMFKRGERVAVCASGKIFESYVFFSFSLSLGFFLFTSSSLFPFSPSPPPASITYLSLSLSTQQ